MANMKNSIAAGMMVRTREGRVRKVASVRSDVEVWLFRADGTSVDVDGHWHPSNLTIVGGR